jgi:hypothetical protein
MSVQSLKLAEQVDANGDAVAFDRQDEKVLAKTYEDDLKWICFIKNIYLVYTNNTKSINPIVCESLFCSHI